MIDNFLYLNNYFTDYFFPNNFHKDDYTPISSQEKEIEMDLQMTRKNHCNDLVSVSSKI